MFRASRQICPLAVVLLLFAPALAKAEESAVVTINNNTGVSLRIGGDFYIDSSGAKQKLDAYWDIPKGKQVKLGLNGPALIAQTFTFSIITPEGESFGWSSKDISRPIELNAEILQLHQKVALPPDTPALGVGTENADSGVKIKSLVADGPADKAGIKVDDVIIGAGARKVNDHESLVTAVRSHKVGDTIVIKVLRDKDTLELKTKLGAASAVTAKYPALTAETVKRMDAQAAEEAKRSEREERIRQISYDIASTKRDIKDQEDKVLAFNFVAIPAAKVALAAAQKKRREVETDPGATFSQLVAAGLVEGAAEALVNETINARNRVQTELNNNTSRLRQLESDLRAIQDR